MSRFTYLYMITAHAVHLVSHTGTDATTAVGQEDTDGVHREFQTLVSA